MRPMSAPLDSRFPGADLVGQGLADLADGMVTEEALLVTAAAPRLRAIGFDVPPGTVNAPLHRLYELLASSDSVDPHSRYNALVARVVSFARAAERAAAG
jgi:hypothetical protein